MIQRVQSLYLLAITIICIAVTTLNITFFRESGKVSEQYEKTVISVDFNSTDTLTQQVSTNNSLIYFLLSAALVSLVAIFLYKNRKLQLKLVLATLVLQIAIMIIMYKLSFGMHYTSIDTQKEVLAGAFMPLSAVIFGFLAYRAIARDEKLVKSLDRIR